MRCRVIATASTGIAADLIFEGATLHSKLRIPLEMNETTKPQLDYESDAAKILRHLEVLIIDEISISHKHVIGYVDRLLRDIDQQHAHLAFAGKVVGSM